MPGVAAGVALVLVAVLAGVVAERAAGTGAAPAAGVTPTGGTTTVRVVAEGMRFHPDRIEVPAGDRLVIQVVNQGERRHDLVLATGARTGSIPAGGTGRLDAGVVGGTVEGWCSLPGHRQQGMVLTVTTTGGSAGTGSADAPDRARAAAGPPVHRHPGRNLDVSLLQ
jgi:nitrite reductase (NO-forming)